MSKLILKRKKRKKLDGIGQTAIKISYENYNKVLDVADETGKSLKQALDMLVVHAYEDIEYESEVE